MLSETIHLAQLEKRMDTLFFSKFERKCVAVRTREDFARRKRIGGPTRLGWRRATWWAYQRV